jgi:hypothetical protein
LLLKSILPAEITFPVTEFAINLLLLTVKLFKTLMSLEAFIFPLVSNETLLFNIYPKRILFPNEENGIFNTSLAKIIESNV